MSSPSVRSFAAAHALGWLNVGAVGFALAACTASVLGLTFPAVLVGAPTLVLGLVWAAAMRRQRTPRWSVWLVAAPLAALNAGVSFGLVVAMSRPTVAEVLMACIYGATIGAILWLPALAVTLVLFGLPMLHAQTLARRGLAAGERGEAFVGQACAALSVLAFFLAQQAFRPSDGWGLGFTGLVALTGAALGTTSWLVAWLRERRRRHFVDGVERGEWPSYRLDPLQEGKVLVRVSPPVAEGAAAYRVSDVREEICVLDGYGRATEPRGARREA